MAACWQGTRKSIVVGEVQTYCAEMAMWRHMQMACWAMGDEHPITIQMLESAEKNLSLKKKMAVVERKRALDKLMVQLQEEEILSSSEISAQLAWEKQDLIPVPERVWALRNTGSTMALGDKRSRAKALDIFRMALQLQQQHLDDPGHPGLLGELWRCDLSGACSPRLPARTCDPSSTNVSISSIVVNYEHLRPIQCVTGSGGV